MGRWEQYESCSPLNEAPNYSFYMPPSINRGVLLVRPPKKNALLVGVSIMGPGFWKLPYTMYYMPYTT